METEKAINPNDVTQVPVILTQSRRLSAAIRAHELWPAWIEHYGSKGRVARSERKRIMSIWRQDIDANIRPAHADSMLCTRKPRWATRAVMARLRLLPTPELLAVQLQIHGELRRRNWR